MPRETKTHFLPTSYDGRCIGKVNVDYSQSFPTFGKIGELQKDETLWKWEMRLPIPDPSLKKTCLENVEKFSLEAYNLSGPAFLQKATDKMKTELDGLFIKVLFGHVFETPEGDVVAYSADVKASTLEVASDIGCVKIGEPIPGPSGVHETYTTGRHLLAQRAVDEWKFVPTGAKKRDDEVSISDFIGQLVATGRVSEADVEGVTDQAELFKRLADLGILGSK